jgi:hypothetical protein
MNVTVLTQFSQVSDVTSTITTRGRGYIHMQFRVGSAISNPSVVLSTMSMTIALQTKLQGGDDNMWCDVQTWAVVGTESMRGTDYAYLVPESGVDARVLVKSFTSGICQARLWEG